MANSFKDFWKTHRIYLLRSATEKYALGDFATKVKKHWIDIENESVVNELRFTSEERKKYRSYLESIEIVDGNIPKISIEKEFISDMSLSIPSKAKGELKVERSKIQNFSYGDIKVKVLDNSGDEEIRRIIEDAVDRYWREDKQGFKHEIGNPKKAFIVEELFYADSVNLKLERNFKLDANASSELENIPDAEVKVGIDSSGSQEISLAGKANVPFAAKVIALSDL